MEDDRSSTSGAGNVYDVFLSFRGPDTRAEFVDFLYNIMRSAGIKVYRDDDELSPGQKIEAILQAINNSRICMPIFSKDFASSAWCLREVERMVELKREIVPVFHHVTPDDAKLKTPLYRDQMKKLEDKHGKDQILLWEVALRQAVESKGRELTDRQGAYGFIDQLVKELLIKLKVKRQNVPDHLVGIDNRVEAAMELLNVGSSGVRMIGIYGAGGIGKTTFAKVMFNQILASFDCCCFLDDVVGELSRTNSIEHLQKQLLLNLDPKLNDLVGLTDAIIRLQTNFRNQKVLIVLDNVDQKQQIENLVGNGSWFGSGSRIIITTRDGSVLDIEDEAPESSNRSQSREVCALELEALNPEQSLQLFCWHAFKRDSPVPEKEDLASQVVGTIGGLPLALEIIGLLLRGKDKSFWKSKIVQLKKIVDPDVKKKLRISFDALEISEQQIFLDIACFFINRGVSNPKYVWEACDLFPTVGLNVLTSRSLVKLREDDTFWMHDQLVILGREIARDRSFKGPEKYYRFYEQKEAVDMLKYKKVNENIIGLRLDKPCGSLTGHCFADLLSLRFLWVKQASLTAGFQHPLPNLKWLSLHSCPENFDVAGLSSSDLVIIDLSHSSVHGKWQGWSQMQTEYLKVLDLSYCHYLEVTPDFSKMVDLEILILKNCVSLTEFTEDLTSLENLKWLYLQNCPRIWKLPESFGRLKSLVCLDLTKTAIRTLPNSIGELEELEQLLLAGSPIRVLPETLGALKSLVVLDLTSSCIVRLPNSIGRLKRLQQLLLFRCFWIKELPESLGDLESLVLLNLSISGLTALPASIGRLKKLERLEMTESKVARLPPQIGELSSLRILNLSRASNIRALPSTIIQLSLLETLVLEECNQLGELPELPGSLTTLHVMSPALVKFPNLSKLSNLRDLKLIDGMTLMKRMIIESSNLKGIGNLTRLENLELGISNATTLPQDLGAMSRLRSLTLCFPSFTFIPQLPTSLRRLQLESGISKLKSLNLSYLGDLVSLSITGFIFTGLSELQLPERLKSLSLSNCQTRSSDCLPPLKNVVHLELLRCKELYEISNLGGLDSLETLNMECCESLERIGNLFELKKLSKVTIFCCPKLNVRPFKFTTSQWSKFLNADVHDERGIWEFLKLQDLQVSEYLAWWEGSHNGEMAPQLGMLNGDISDIVAADDVVAHDLSSLLSSRDRDFLIRNNGQRVQIDKVIKCNRGDRIVLLFSASWCESSQLFILLVKEYFKDKPLDVVIFVSVDEDDESFRSHFSMMPWLAIPFSDSDKCSSLVRLFNVMDIPHLVTFDEHGKAARTELYEVIRVPLPRTRYPCPLELLKLFKVQKEAARRNQSLGSVLVHGPFDYVHSSKGSTIPVSRLEGKIVGLYFSFPLLTSGLIEFNQRLIEVYEELKNRGEDFEIVSICPSNKANLIMGNLDNFYIMPMNLDKYTKLVSYFELKNLPALVIIGSDGGTLNVDAVKAVKEHGAAAYPFTMEKLAQIGWEIVGKREAAWRKQTLRSALAHCPSLPFSELEGKVVGLYFSHPSLSCVEFTLDLLDVYEKLKARSEPFEIVSIYLQRYPNCDEEQSFWQSFGTVPWLSLKSSFLICEEMASYFKVSALPTLVIIGKDGEVVNFNAVDMIKEHGAGAYPFTPEKLVQMANAKEISGEIRDAGLLWPKKLHHHLHDHQLVPTVRTGYICIGPLTAWRGYTCECCDQEGKVWSYYCEECDFDVCCDCVLKYVREQASVPSRSHIVHCLERWCCLPFLSFRQGCPFQILFNASAVNQMRLNSK